jgi:Cu+-exporting ATPase
LEQGSEHPLAAAILAAAKDRGVAPVVTTDFKSITGKGARAKQNGGDVALGNKALLADVGASIGDNEKRAEELRADGQTVIYVVKAGQVIGMIGIADPIKSTTRAALDALRKDGVHVVMLTGDSKTTAGAVAKKLGITNVEAEVLPDQKREIVQRYESQGRKVAMAGDGINDAPALSQALVGIAMGTGTDVAMESAGITLVKGDLNGIVRARRLSHAVMSNIRQNLFFAFIYNTLGVPIAAGILFPFFGILLSPIIAAAAMSLSSVSVIANSLRLRSVEL